MIGDKKGHGHGMNPVERSHMWKNVFFEAKGPRKEGRRVSWNQTLMVCGSNEGITCEESAACLC